MDLLCQYVFAQTDSEEDDIELLSYDTPVDAPSLGVWEEPDIIRVNIYADGEDDRDNSQGTPTDVDFKTYCYKVTMQEFGTDTFSQEARKAVALAVKNLGWNRTLVQKYGGFEFDISYARDNGGVISQEAANEKGLAGSSWQTILHDFYDYGEYNSHMTSGLIRIVNLTHAQTGSSYQSTNLRHWLQCTTCGCIHSKDVHTWVSYPTYYMCSVCGRTSTSAPSVNFIEETELEHQND